MEQEFLKKWFTYDEGEGLRCLLPGREPHPWLPLGKNLRYLCVNVGREKLYLHRLVWQYFHNEVPGRIDHIDGDTRNNKIENLRPCSAAQNQYNSKRKINNKSGAKGVVLHKKCKHKKWQAKITVDKKVVSLGYFATVEEAGAAYVAAAEFYAKEFANAG